MPKPDRYIPLDELSRRAADLFAARNVLRLREWYIRACRAAPAHGLFHAMAMELAKPAPERSRLRSIAAEADAALAKHEFSLQRAPLVTIESVGRAPQHDRALDSRGSPLADDLFFMKRDHAKRDVIAWLRAEWADFERLRSARPLPALKDFGSLWTDPPPAWLSLSWPDDAAHAKHLRRVLGEDAPQYHTRPAPLYSPSDRLPEAFLDALGPLEFALRYSSTRITRVPKKVAGTFPVVMSVPRPARKSIELPGQHRFRRPAPRGELAALRARSGASRRLKPLIDFYQLHNGALLFLPDGTPAHAAHVDLVALQDQPLVRESFRHQFGEGEPETPAESARYARFLDGLHCEHHDLHIIAIVGVSILVTPMLGMNQGRVYRVAPRARLVQPWADGFIPALARLPATLPSLCRRAPLLMRLDSDPPRTYSEMRLLRVTPAID